jgi:hypothetical protein
VELAAPEFASQALALVLVGSGFDQASERMDVPA